jgi:hypothetical protein
LNPYKEALREPANLVVAAALLAASAATLSVIPALVAIVAEVGYILFVPESSWYKSRLERRSSQLPNQAQDRIQEPPRASIERLPPELQGRYQRLLRVRSEVGRKLRSQASSAPEITDKLDTLLQQFVGFSANMTQYQEHLQSVLIEQGDTYRSGDPYVIVERRAGASENAPRIRPVSQTSTSTDQWAQWAVGRIQSRFNTELNKIDPASEPDPSLKELKQKRVDVLMRRNTQVGQMGKALVNLSLQLQLIEDTFGLIDDEVSAQRTDHVVGEIDHLMQQTDALTKSLQEVDDLFAQKVVGA